MESLYESYENKNDFFKDVEKIRRQNETNVIKTRKIGNFDYNNILLLEENRIAFFKKINERIVYYDGKNGSFELTEKCKFFVKNVIHYDFKDSKWGPFSFFMEDFHVIQVYRGIFCFYKYGKHNFAIIPKKEDVVKLSNLII